MSQKTETEPTKTSERPWWLNINMVGVLLVLVAFGISMKRVFSIREQLEGTDGTTIIRISHWQLELGYRDALQHVINMYQEEQAKLGRKVRVLQMPVTERVYGPWLNTNLISQQAPDIVLMGMSGMLSSEQYLARYFRPLTDLVDQPNPHNKGTELENVPWRETYFDGMRGAYNVKLQDYFMVPTASYTMRIFYNKKLFEEIGQPNPPQTFGQLMDVCQRISEHATKTNRTILPIAGSKYSYLTFVNRYAVSFTANLEKDLDLDLDGSVTPQEVYAGHVRGKLRMDLPNVKAFYALLRELSTQFGPGFIGKDRQTAAFEFVQQRAAMISSGSWDAQSLFAQAEKAGFDVGIFDFPLPAAGEPYGEYIVGKTQEATIGASGAYGLYKYSRQPDAALDFLQFLTSKRINQIHMERTNWIPVVRGTEPKGKMAVFAPNPIGFNTGINPVYGAEMSSRYSGELQSYLQGDSTFNRLAGVVDTAFRDPLIGGDWAWYWEYSELVKQVRTQERSLAAHSIRGLLLGAEDAQHKHRQIMLQQLKVNNGETMRRRFEDIRGVPITDVEQRRGG
jgi:raffinose/stachyose/melibiose transport system substrate-binding protein